MCHRCFVPIPPPSPPKPAKGAKALEGPKGEAAEKQGQQGEADGGKQEAAGAVAEAAEDTPPALDPCLPRYCPGCSGRNAELDARLAAVRSRLLGLAKRHHLEPELLQLLLLLEVQRAGAGGKLAQDVPGSAVPEGAAAPPTLRCAPADMALVPSMWDRKGEGWRKMIVASTKVLHKVRRAGGRAGGRAAGAALVFGGAGQRELVGRREWI